MRLLLTLLLLSGSVSAWCANIDYRSLLTNYFTTNIPSAFYVGINTNGVITFNAINTNSILTNGFVLVVNTNVNSTVYNAITNLIQNNGSPQVWTNDGTLTYPIAYPSNLVIRNFDGSVFTGAGVQSS